MLATPFPDRWRDVLHRDVPHHQLLTADEQATLRDAMRVLIAELRWEGCGGLAITDAMKVLVAAQACYMVLGLSVDALRHVRTVLLYPGAYVDPRAERGVDGLVFREVRVGESWSQGSVVLSWPEVRAGARRANDGRNLVFHEFAHQLDFLLDGTPPLARRADRRQWQAVMGREYERLCAAADAGRPTLLDHYGASSTPEFLAVAVECFFERPVEMRQRHAELYALLLAAFRQDPAVRVESNRQQPRA